MKIPTSSRPLTIFGFILDVKGFLLITRTSVMPPARRTDYLDKDDLKVAVTAMLGFRPSKVLITWCDYMVLCFN